MSDSKQSTASKSVAPQPSINVRKEAPFETDFSPPATNPQHQLLSRSRTGCITLYAMMPLPPHRRPLDGVSQSDTHLCMPSGCTAWCRRFWCHWLAGPMTPKRDPTPISFTDAKGDALVLHHSAAWFPRAVHTGLILFRGLVGLVSTAPLGQNRDISAAPLGTKP